MGWSDKYKKSINCNNPKGFSQKAHCAGKKKRENIMKVSDLKNEIRTIVNERSINKIAKEQQKNAVDIEKALDFYKKNKGTDKAKAFIKVLKQLGDKKKALAKEMDIAVSSKLRNVGYAGPLESVNEGISVFDERHFGKKGIIIMIDDNGKKVSAIFKDKKNADKFNRNNPSDIKKLLQLAKKTKYPKAIDESVNEAVSKKLKYRSRIGGDILIEIEEDPAGIFVDVRMKGKTYNALLSTTDIEYPSGHINVTPRVKNIPIKESVNEMDPYLKPTPKDDEEVDESINEGASTEEKRIAMLAVRKQAKYRNVDTATAIQDQIRALEELKRDLKKGKIK